MFDVFGNFDSVEELNACAKGLLEEQDLEHLKVLAEENGIPDGIREVYEQHLSEELVDSVNAAIGKLQVELKEETDGMPAGEIVSYLSMRCFEKEILARAVRRKNRTLKECLQNIRKEAEKRVKVRSGSQMVAMPDLEVFAWQKNTIWRRRNETRRVIKASRVKSNGNDAKDSRGRSRTSGTKMWKTTCLECNILLVLSCQEDRNGFRDRCIYKGYDLGWHSTSGIPAIPFGRKQVLHL